MDMQSHPPAPQFPTGNRLAWLVGLAIAVAAASLGVGHIVNLLGLSMLGSAAAGQVALLSVALLFALLDGGGFRNLGFPGVWRSYDAAIVAALVGIQLAGSVLTTLLTVPLGVNPQEEQVYELLKAFGNYDTATFLVIALALALQSGITEELLFRGYVVTRLEQAGFRAWTCIVVSALVFGLAHWPGYGFWPSISKALWLGIPSAAFFWYRRSLGQLMVAHAAINFIGFMTAHLIQKVAPFLPSP